MGSILVCDCRRHPVAAIIDNPARQREGLAGLEAASGSDLLRTGQCLLNRIEEITVDDGLVLAGEVLCLVDDLADIDPVAQEISQ